MIVNGNRSGAVARFPYTQMGLIPAPGAIEIPRSMTEASPFPVPISHPLVYEKPRGFPISITFDAFVPWRQSTLAPIVSTMTLIDLSTNEEVPGFIFSYADINPKHPDTPLYFLPSDPLKPRCKYLCRAEVRFQNNSAGPNRGWLTKDTIRWSFTTQGSEIRTEGR